MIKPIYVKSIETAVRPKTVVPKRDIPKIEIYKAPPIEPKKVSQEKLKTEKIKEKVAKKNIARHIEGLNDIIINVVDEVTKAPGELRKQADDLTDALIGLGGSLRQDAAGSSLSDDISKVAGKNLTQGKIDALGTSASRWISSGKNWMIVLGIVVVVLFFAGRGLK